MTQPKCAENFLVADARAKSLYGSRAFAEEVKPGDFRVCIDESFQTGKKFHKMALLMGWGGSWEEAFEQAEIRKKWQK